MTQVLTSMILRIWSFVEYVIVCWFLLPLWCRLILLKGFVCLVVLIFYFVENINMILYTLFFLIQ